MEAISLFGSVAPPSKLSPDRKLERRMTKRQAAEAVGCSVVTITKLLQTGVLSPELDPAVVFEEWEAYQNRVAGRKKILKTEAAARVRASGANGDDGQDPMRGIHAERERLTRLRADETELKTGILRREFVRKDAVVMAGGEVLGNLKQGLLNLPSRMGPVLAVEDDPNVVADILRKEVTRLLEEAAGKLQAVGDEVDNEFKGTAAGRGGI